MQLLTLAVPTRVFGGSIRESLREAADCGVSEVQFDLRTELQPEDWGATATAELLRHVRDLGLSVKTAAFPLRYSLYDEQHLDERVNAVRKAMQFAGQLKIRTINVRPGRLPADDAVKPRSLLIEVLNDLSRAGSHAGVTMCLTPTGDSAAAMKGILSEIRQGPAAIDFDAAAFAMAGKDVPQSARELHGSIGHVTLRDGQRDVDGGGVETALGRGEVPWVNLIATLGEMDYKGIGTVTRTQGEDPADDVRRAVTRLKRDFHL